MSRNGIGQSVAQVDEIFQRRVQELQEAARRQAAAITEQKQRRWQMPQEDDWDGNTLDIAAWQEPYKRDGLAENYQEAVKDPTRPGTASDTIALKLQADYLAALERAQRTRHRTALRAAIHAAARRRGQGSDAGVFDGGVSQYISNIIRQGSSE